LNDGQIVGISFGGFIGIIYLGFCIFRYFQIIIDCFDSYFRRICNCCFKRINHILLKEEIPPNYDKPPDYDLKSIELKNDIKI